MFTGLVEAIGVVRAAERGGRSLRLVVESTLAPYVLGESISVNGACLTVASQRGQTFVADVSEESLSVTTLGSLAPQRRVNLERASRVGDHLGGHFVLGHVDTTGVFLGRELVDGAQRVRFEVGAGIGRFIAAKGSIAIDGVSLTVNTVSDAQATTAFSIMLVPHTLAHTTLGDLTVGSSVNVEADVLARYAARFLATMGRGEGSEKGALDAGAELPYERDAALLAKLRAGGFTD